MPTPAYSWLLMDLYGKSLRSTTLGHISGLVNFMEYRQYHHLYVCSESIAVICNSFQNSVTLMQDFPNYLLPLNFFKQEYTSCNEDIHYACKTQSCFKHNINTSLTSAIDQNTIQLFLTQFFYHSTPEVPGETRLGQPLSYLLNNIPSRYVFSWVIGFRGQLSWRLFSRTRQNLAADACL